MTSRRTQYTGHEQGGRDRQAADGRSDPPALLLQEGGGFPDHNDLGVQQFEAGFLLWRGQIALPESLNLEHRVPAWKKCPCRQDRRDNRDDQPDLKRRCRGDRRAGHASQTDQHPGKPEDDASFVIEALPVGVHRIALGRDLGEQDVQRR